jgi:hypothetical protein
VAEDVKTHFNDNDMKRCIDSIRQRFRDINAEGPAWVANFISADLEVRKRVKAEAFVVVQEFLDSLE